MNKVYQSIPIVAKILARLETELPVKLTFHSAEHTRDVISETIFFAKEEGGDDRELELLAIAAVYHDAGFLEGTEGHEERGAEMAVRAMRESNSIDSSNYIEDEMGLVSKMIVDTKFSYDKGSPLRNPQDRLSSYLLDADMSNLGRDDFFERLDAYCQETGVALNDYKSNMIDLMERHRWFTQVAKNLREQKKQENFKRLVNLQ